MAHSERAESRIDTELAGYRIEALIGRGGMSTVYKAEDLTLGRKVALKLMSDELSSDESFRERFRAEWRLAASIDHPNVIPIHEAGEAAGQLFIAMRYVEGTDLKKLLHEEGALSSERVLALVSQAAAGLDAAHKRGLVHRDVKPSNILIAKDDDEEHVYLADFGLTKAASFPEEAMATITLSGSSDYVSPEQIVEGTPQASSDIYSLGALLYECLTGEVPYPREQELQTLWAHLDEPPPRPSEANPDLPEALDGVIATAMAKEPAERYASGAELVAAAQAALPTRRISRRRLALLALLLTLLIAAAIAVPALLLTGGGEDTAPTGEPTLEITVDTLQRIDPATNELIATVPLDFGVGGIALTDGAAWAIEAEERTYILYRIDLATNTATEATRIVGGPYGPSRGIGGMTELGEIAASSESVWLATSDRAGGTLGGPQESNATLTEFDPQAAGVTTATPLPISPGYRGLEHPLPVGGVAHQSPGPGRVGAIWITSPLEQAVIRVDLAFGQRAAHTILALDTPPVDVAVGEGAVWVTQIGAILRLDPQSGRVTETIPVSFLPSDIAVGEGAVWVASPTDRAVLKIDPVTNQVVAAIEVGDEPRALGVGNGSVWVADTRDEAVSRIDPVSGETLTTIDIGARPSDLAVSPSGIWAAVHPLASEEEPLTEEEYVAALRRLDAWWSPRFWALEADLASQLWNSDWDLVLQNPDEFYSRWPVLMSEFRSGYRGLVDDLTAIIPATTYTADHELLIQFVDARSRQLERLNEAVEAREFAAILEPLYWREGEAVYDLILESFDRGKADDIRRQMSPEFRTISALHITA